MLGRGRRRQEVRALVERAHGLPPEQVGQIMAFTLGNALLTLVAELVLLVLYGRAVRDGWRARHRGFRAVLDTRSGRQALASTLVLVGYAYGSRALLLHRIRLMVQRAEAHAQTEEEPS